ncbi:MAG: hypothetical protein NTV29_16920 [Planctomycetota bacterium]|nr:hypothetical protein [Planctomycetota bacterium]
MKRFIWTATLAAVLGQVGCDSGKKDQVAQTNSTNPSNVAGNPIASNTKQNTTPEATVASEEMVPLSSLNLKNPTRPEEIVGAFLEGMRTSNAQVIESLLSTRARQEIKSKGLEISPIGSPNAAFEIGKAQMIDPKDPNVMLVSSNWLEPGISGKPASQYEVVWALIKEVDGWRICEMAVDTHTEGEEVQVVNFENLTEIAGESTGERTAALPNSNSQAPALPGNTPNLPAANPGLPPSNPGLPPSNSGLPANNLGLPANNLGLPANNLGLPASNLGLPANNSGLPPSNSGLPAGNAGGLPPLPPNSGSNFPAALPPAGLPPLGPR